MTRSDSPADLSQEDDDDLPKEVPTVPPPTGGGDAYSAATVVKTVSSELLEKAREQREKRPVPAAGAPAIPAAAPSTPRVASSPVAPSAPRVASAAIAPSPVRVAAAAPLGPSASAPREKVAEKVPSEPPAQVVVSLSEEKDETVEGGTQVMPETRQREAALIAYAQTSRVTPPANADDAEASQPVARPPAQAPTSWRVWVPMIVVAVLLLLALVVLKR